MKRYFKALGYLLSVHVLALLVMTLFRLVEFIALHGMIVDAEASRVMAFVKGVWFDNVIACYISVLPVAVLLIAASLGWCHRRLLRGINIWYAAWFAIAFMPSAANTPYFQYFFKNINSSIFGWFGYVATTSGMLLQESSYWLYIALYFVFTGSFIYALVRLRRYFEGLFLLPKDNMHLVQVVSRFLISAVMIGACLFGIRGRMGYNPIKVSQAYYCEDSFLNQLGINPAFNLLTSALDDMRKENKELHLMPYAEAITNTRQWLGITGKVDSTNILKREVVNSFGVSDHFEMDYALNTINQKAKTGKPFMATILTVSNHPPYIIPDFFKPKTKEKETQIVEYADWAIGDFLKKASREPWYKNTIFVIQADHGKLVGKSEGELPQSYNHIPLIIFGPGVPQQQYAGLGMQVDVMPTLFGLMNLNYEYEGFGVDLLKQERPMVFYSADNQIVARDHQRCFVYNPSMNRSFCYDVLPNGNLKETKLESKFQDLKNYVFSNIQAAEYIERHQQ